MGLFGIPLRDPRLRDPLVESILNPGDPAAKMRQGLQSKVVQKMTQEPPTLPGPDFQPREDVGQFQTQQQPSIAPNFDPNPNKTYFDKRSDDALDSYSKSRLGINNEQYGQLKDFGQSIPGMVFPPGAEYGVVPPMVKAARRAVEFASGRAPVKTLEGASEEVARRIAKREAGSNFHATSPSSMEKIIESGVIMPNETLHQGAGYKASQELIAKKAAEYKAAKGQKIVGPIQTKKPTAGDLLAQRDKLEKNYDEESKKFTDWIDFHPEGVGKGYYPDNFLEIHGHLPEVQAAGKKYEESKQALDDFYDHHDMEGLANQHKLDNVKSNKWAAKKPFYDYDGNHATTEAWEDPSGNYAIAKDDKGNWYPYRLDYKDPNDPSKKLPSEKMWQFKSSPSKSMAEAKKKLAKHLQANLGEEEKVGEDIGVSTSRIPRVSPKAEKAVSMQIDPKKMPPVRPFTEPGYGKTKRGYDMFNVPTMDEAANAHLTADELKQYKEAQDKHAQIYNTQPYDYQGAAEQGKIVSDLGNEAMNRWRKAKGRAMNERFEYENRTKGKPIDFGAVNEILVDRSALGNKLRSTTQDEQLWDIFATPEEKNKFGEFPDFDPDAVKYWQSVVDRIWKEQNQDLAQKVVESLRNKLGPDFPITVYNTGREMHRHHVEQFRGQKLEGKTVSPLREHERRVGEQLMKSVEKKKEKLVER